METTRTIKGHKIGPDTVKLDEPLPEETTDIEVVVRARKKPEPPPLDPDDPTGWKAIDRVIGCIKGAPWDVAENHDKHVYSEPHD